MLYLIVLIFHEYIIVLTMTLIFIYTFNNIVSKITIHNTYKNILNLNISQRNVNQAMITYCFSAIRLTKISQGCRKTGLYTFLLRTKDKLS